LPVIKCDRAVATASASIRVTRQLSFNFFIHGLGGAWPRGPPLDPLLGGPYRESSR